MLRSVMTMAGLLGADYALAVVYVAILQANLAGLDDDPALAARYAGLDDIVPDSLHRPISVHALAHSLHMPYETTRRCVGRLIDRGFVVRVSRNGVVARSARLAEPDCRRVVEQDYGEAMRMIAQLRRLGVDLDGA